MWVSLEVTRSSIKSGVERAWVCFWIEEFLHRLSSCSLSIFISSKKYKRFEIETILIFATKLLADKGMDGVEGERMNIEGWQRAEVSQSKSKVMLVLV